MAKTTPARQGRYTAFWQSGNPLFLDRNNDMDTRKRRMCGAAIIAVANCVKTAGRRGRGTGEMNTPGVCSSSDLSEFKGVGRVAVSCAQAS